MRTLILSLAILASTAPAFAASGTLLCNVAVPKDPVNRAEQYDNEIYKHEFTAEEKQHFVIVSKDASVVTPLSENDYNQRIEQKNFSDIDGQTLVRYARASDELVTITVRDIDATSEKGFVRGSLTLGNGNHIVAVIPADKGFAAACSTRH